MSLTKQELEAAFTMGLSTAARKMRNLFDSRVRERGLTLARARVVRLLDGLEKQGLIYRAAVEGDRRAKRIELTDEAQAQVKQLQAITQAIRAELLQRISPQALETALTVFQEISQTVETALTDKDR